MSQQRRVAKRLAKARVKLSAIVEGKGVSGSRTHVKDIEKMAKDALTALKSSNKAIMEERRALYKKETEALGRAIEQAGADLLAPFDA